MRYYSLEKLINMYDGYRANHKIDQHNLMLLQIDGERYLIESLCPHRGHPLSESNVDGLQLHCPLHDYRFEIDTGTLIHSTEEPCRALKTYEIVYQGNDIGVML